MAVAQGDGVVDDAGKVRVGRRFPVAGKGEHVGHSAFGLHEEQLRLKCSCHFGARGALQVRAVVAVEATLAVDAVERAELSVGRHEVDAQ